MKITPAQAALQDKDFNHSLRCDWRAATYRPVAVTPQINLKLSEELDGKLGNVMPGPGGLCKLAIVTLAAAGQTAAPVATVQVTDVQLKPVTTGSFNTEPAASAGPVLATVTV